MLSSLLTLFITSNLSKGFSDNPENLVKLASSNLESLTNTSLAPTKKTEFISPIIKAKSSIAIDLTTGTVLYEKNMHQRLPIASITKLMTCLIILEENQPDQVVTISPSAARIEGSNIFLHAGEKLTISSLIESAIIHSANDSAFSLAEFNAGSSKAFVEKMNTKATSIGLINTHFANPVGLDDRKNYSSAYDVAKLAQIIYKNPFIKKIAKIKNTEIRSVSGDTTHKLESTNELLENQFFKINGLKTGSTQSAGECFVSIAENPEGHEILTVVLNSPSRFTETKVLADWIFRAYNW